ncbi:prenyltransferase [Methyloversatilis universalis]|nr:prenyltransferase [Methyloversatilis universalis]
MSVAAAAPSLSLKVRMTRPGFLTITAVAVLIGVATAAHDGHFEPLRAAVSVLLAILAHAAANVLNDYHDALNGADAANRTAISPFTGGSRLIQNGEVSVRDTGRLATALLAVVVPAGIALAAFSGPGLLVIGLAGLLLGWAYSAPPLALMKRGLGELTVGASWSLLVIGGDYVQRAGFSALPLAASLSLALLVADILLINGFPDAVSDASVGKRTLVVRLGHRTAAWLYVWVALAAYAVLIGAVVAGLLPAGTLAGLLSLPLSWRAARSLRAAGGDVAHLPGPIRLSVLSATLHGLLLAAGLLAGG